MIRFSCASTKLNRRFRTMFPTITIDRSPKRTLRPPPEALKCCSSKERAPNRATRQCSRACGITPKDRWRYRPPKSCAYYLPIRPLPLRPIYGASTAPFAEICQHGFSARIRRNCRGPAERGPQEKPRLPAKEARAFTNEATCRGDAASFAFGSSVFSWCRRPSEWAYPASGRRGCLRSCRHFRTR